MHVTHILTNLSSEQNLFMVEGLPSTISLLGGKITNI